MLRFDLKKILLKLSVGAVFLLGGFLIFGFQASAATIFYETFPNADAAWNGSSDTAQLQSGWAVYQGNGDIDDVRVNNVDIAAGTTPPSGGNHLTFNDSDQGFASPETYDIAYVSVDLSGYINSTIEYYWQSDDVDAGEGLRVAYSIDSTNGRDGTWTQIAQHIDPTDDQWNLATFNLPDTACVSNFKLRFSSRSTDTTENMLVDDVKITGCHGNGSVCAITTECCSNNCSSDHDGVGKFCCASGSCAHNGICYASGLWDGGYICNAGAWQNHCTNNVQDADETGIDCGGTSCLSCSILCQDHDVHGWAWSDNIGWISFNCIEGGLTQNNICASSSYGVIIASSTGIISGDAWSDNIGWISFDAADTVGCPLAPCAAQVTMSGAQMGQVSGWARTLNSIGTDYGWISLRDALYGIDIDTSTGHFNHYAWGGGTTTSTAVIGWISSNCNQGGSGGSDICATRSYYIWTDAAIFNTPPYVENLNVAGPSNSDLCNNTASYLLGWTFRDIDVNAYENTYELKLTNTGTGASGTSSPGPYPYPPPMFDDGHPQSQGILIGTSESLSLIPLRVQYGQTYAWEVKVQDNLGSWSTPSSGPVIIVPINYPECGFTMNPTKPKIGDEINFQDTSTSNIGAYLIENYFWNFGDGTNINTQNATHTYSEVSPRTVTHTIYFDSGTKSCSTSTTFNVRPGQPEYIEVIPR